MKKILLFVSIIFVLVLAACGGEKSSEDKEDPVEKENIEIVIGASSTPHEEILREALPLLEEKGITLKIEQYQDFVFPNDDLASGKLDANYFQHAPYLEEVVETTGYDLDYIDGIHIEPMGIYSKTIESLDDIADGTEVILSNSVADHGRILTLLETENLIKLDEAVNKDSATFDDIVDNPKNLVFSPDYEPAFLPELYNTELDTLIAINTNYALDADLNPSEDALIIEGNESLYANIIAVRSEDLDNEALNTLVEVLQAEEIQNFIIEKYEGAVAPIKGSK